MRDLHGRPLRDLRISVTDRCNFRCTYCMPKEVFGRDHAFLRREELLSFEEVARVARIAVSLGVEKVRLTGGEPMLRRDLERLVEQLASIDGLHDVALTTNGSLLTREKADALKRAGLRRITVSLDALDDATFRAMNDVDFPVARVLEAIDNAADAGLGPIKIDAVIKRSVNEQAVVDLARHFRGSGHIVRFIEFMDVGNTNGWQMGDVVSAREILAMLQREWALVPVEANYFGEVAERWQYADGAGEIGIITSVTQPFCGSCTRARLSASGELYLCLFASRGHDLRALLRGGASDEELRDVIANVWRARDDRYSEVRSEATPALPRYSFPPLYFSAAELGTVVSLTAFSVFRVTCGPNGCRRPLHVFSRIARPSLICWIWLFFMPGKIATDGPSPQQMRSCRPSTDGAPSRGRSAAAAARATPNCRWPRSARMRTAAAIAR